MFRRFISLLPLLNAAPATQPAVLVTSEDPDSYLLQLCNDRILEEQKRLSAGTSTQHLPLPNRRPVKYQGAYEFALDLRKILEDKADVTISSSATEVKPAKPVKTKSKIQYAMQHLDKFYKANPNAKNELIRFLQPFVKAFPNYWSMLPKDFQQDKALAQDETSLECFYDVSFLFEQMALMDAISSEAFYSVTQMLVDFPINRFKPGQSERCIDIFYQTATRKNSNFEYRWHIWHRQYGNRTLIPVLNAILRMDPSWLYRNTVKCAHILLLINEKDQCESSLIEKVMCQLNSYEKCYLLMHSIQFRQNVNVLQMAACFTDDDKSYFQRLYESEITMCGPYRLYDHLIYARGALTDKIQNKLIARFLNEYRGECTEWRNLLPSQDYFKKPLKLSPEIFNRCEKEVKRLATSDDIDNCIHVAFLGILMGNSLSEAYKCRVIENNLQQEISFENIGRFVTLLKLIWNKPMENSELQDKLVAWLSKAITKSTLLYASYLVTGLRPKDHVILFDSFMTELASCAIISEEDIQKVLLVSESLCALLTRPIQLSPTIDHIKVIVKIALEQNRILYSLAKLLSLLIKQFKSQPFKLTDSKEEEVRRSEPDLFELVSPLIKIQDSPLANYDLILLADELIADSSNADKEKMVEILLVRLSDSEITYVVRAAILNIICKILPSILVTRDMHDAISKSILFKLHCPNSLDESSIDISDDCYKILLCHLNSSARKSCLAAAVEMVQKTPTVNSCAMLGVISSTLVTNREKEIHFQLLLDTLMHQRDHAVNESALAAMVNIMNSVKGQAFRLHLINSVKQWLQPTAKLDPSSRLAVQRSAVVLNEIYLSARQTAQAVGTHANFPSDIANLVIEYAGSSFCFKR